MKLVILFLIFSLPSIVFSAPQLKDLGPNNRLELLEHNFKSDDFKANIWQKGFMSLFAVSSTINAVIYFTEDDKDKKFDAGVDLIKASLGLGDLLINPIVADKALGIFNSESDPKAKIRIGENLLAKASAREMYERSWTNHLLSGLVNGLGGVAIAYIDDREKDGLINFLVGMAVSEIKIFTSPKRAIKGNINYQYQYGSYTKSKAWYHDLNFVPLLNGIKISYQF